MSETILVTAEAFWQVYATIVRPDGFYLDLEDYAFKPLAAYPVAGVVTGGAGSAAFRVPGDITAELATGRKCRIRGSTGNDGVYTIRAGVTYAAPQTTIPVEEAVSHATADGMLHLHASPVLTLQERSLSPEHSQYVGSLDPTRFPLSLEVIEANILARRRMGTNPNLATDPVIAQAKPPGLVVQLRQIGRRHLTVKGSVWVNSTNGVAMQLAVELLADGAPVPLAAIDPQAECVASVIGHGNLPLFDLDASEMGTVNASHRFEATYANPNLTADHLHYVVFTITAAGWTVTSGGIRHFGALP